MDDSKRQTFLDYTRTLHATIEFLQCEVKALHTVLSATGRADLEELYQRALYENLHMRENIASRELQTLVDRLDKQL